MVAWGAASVYDKERGSQKRGSTNGYRLNVTDERQPVEESGTTAGPGTFEESTRLRWQAPLPPLNHLTDHSHGRGTVLSTILIFPEITLNKIAVASRGIPILQCAVAVFGYAPAQTLQENITSTPRTTRRINEHKNRGIISRSS